MNKLSTGDDSTLGNWLRLSIIFFGVDSPAVKFIERKIAASPNGKDEEVIADESQLIYLLTNLDAETPDESPFFECPECHRRSYNLKDIETGYCAHCNKYFK